MQSLLHCDSIWLYAWLPAFESYAEAKLFCFCCAWSTHVQRQQIPMKDLLDSTCDLVQVVPITNADMKQRIHQTYRMGYIKDVILPRVN